MRKCAWAMIAVLLVSVSCALVLKAPDIARSVEYKVTELRLQEQVKKIEHEQRMRELRAEYAFEKEIASAGE
jgi:hypothetical protein